MGEEPRLRKNKLCGRIPPPSSRLQAAPIRTPALQTERPAYGSRPAPPIGHIAALGADAERRAERRHLRRKPACALCTASRLSAKIIRRYPRPTPRANAPAPWPAGCAALVGAALNGQLRPLALQRRSQPGITVNHGQHRYSSPPLTRPSSTSPHKARSPRRQSACRAPAAARRRIAPWLPVPALAPASSRSAPAEPAVQEQIANLLLLQVTPRQVSNSSRIRPTSRDTASFHRGPREQRRQRSAQPPGVDAA